MNDARRCAEFLLQLCLRPASIAVLGFLWLAKSAALAPLHIDEARWSYVAGEWIHHGLPPYLGVIENKPPGIFILGAVSDILWGHQYWFLRLLGILSIVATSLLLYRIGTAWRDAWAGRFAMIGYVFACAWSSYDGTVPSMTESFMNLFSVLAFYWIATARPGALEKPRSIIIAGFFIGCAIAFKQVALTTLLGLASFILILRLSGFEKKRTEGKGKRSSRILVSAQTLLWLAGGIVLATVASVAPLLASGVSWHEYVQGAWTILFNPGQFGLFPGTTASWATRVRLLPNVFTRLDTFIAPLCWLALLKMRQSLKHHDIPVPGLLVWMACDFIGVHISGYYFDHQFKQLLPSLSLGIGLVLRQLVEVLASSSVVREKNGLIWTSWLLLIGMIASPQMPPLTKVLARVLHPAPIPEQLVGAWLKAHTRPHDPVFVVEVFSDLVQYYAERPSASRYYNTHYIHPAVVPEVTHDLTVKRPPRFIVLWHNQAPDWLWTIIAKRFTFRHNLAGYWLYESTETIL